MHQIGILVLHSRLSNRLTLRARSKCRCWLFGAGPWDRLGLARALPGFSAIQALIRTPALLLFSPEERAHAYNPTHGRLQEHLEFEVSLNYISRASLSKQNKDSQREFRG